MKIPESEVTSVSRTDEGSRSRTEVKPKIKSHLSQGDGDKQFVDNEKRSAEKFIEELTKFIPELVTQYSVTDVDEALQQFAGTYADSKYCKVRMKTLGNCNVFHEGFCHCDSFLHCYAIW